MLGAAGLLYTLFGRPDLPDQPLVKRTAELAEKQAEASAQTAEILPKLWCQKVGATRGKMAIDSSSPTDAAPLCGENDSEKKVPMVVSALMITARVVLDVIICETSPAAANRCTT